ncbi:MAG: ABC transporter permease [Chloroflexota bacterium]
MRRLLIRRGLQSLLVALGVGLLAFVITRLLPGDPAATWAGPRATEAQLVSVRIQLGLDQPLPGHVWSYMSDLVRGDWGTSIHTRQPVLSDVAGRFMTSLELVGLSMLLAGLVGIPLGVAAARWRGRAPDWGAGLSSALLASVPVFWLALVLQLVFATSLHWLPVAGRWDRGLNHAAQEAARTHMVLVDSILAGNPALFWSGLAHLVLPAIVIAAYPIALFARLTRAGLLETMGEEHIRMARAIGYPERTVIWRFALRPSMGPVLSALALVFGFALGNTFLVENLFNFQGLGSYAVDSIAALDAPAIAGTTIFVALAYLVANFLVDMARPLMDPRLREPGR